MKHFSYNVDTQDTLKKTLSLKEIQDLSSTPTILVQVYSAATNRNWIKEVTKTILSSFPQAIVVGATTVGEIVNGKTLTGATVVGFSFFSSSTIEVFSQWCEEGREDEASKKIVNNLLKTSEKIAGVLLLSTPLSLDASKVLQGFDNPQLNCPIFGGGAGDYASMDNSLVFYQEDIYSQGIVAVVFKSDELFIDIKTYLGWKPLSKEMVMTDVEGLTLKKIDNIPAYKIYEKYLGIEKSQNFFQNVLEFPLLVERDGELIARVPVFVNESDEIQFVADIKEGEKFRIGYGDPNLIINDASSIHQLAKDFSPEVVFLYSCGCRRFLMQEDTNLETLPFEEIAPTFGFYTYGEFFNGNSQIQLLNSTMVVVSMREGTPLKEKTPKAKEELNKFDPYESQHARIISRLIHFIEAVSDELEDRNQEVVQLAETDTLTGINNRLKLDKMIDYYIDYSKRCGEKFSVIMLDIDYFKSVNDIYGHLVGDKALKKVSETLQQNIRTTDIVGRWGGEEFLIVLPQTNIEQATVLAEKLREKISLADFAQVGKKTASFGVTTYTNTDTYDSLIQRVDEALYRAKKEGRDRVVFAK